MNHPSPLVNHLLSLSFNSPPAPPCGQERLAKWESCGRRAYDFMSTGPTWETQTVDLSFLGTSVLPEWLGTLSQLRALNLTGCESLQTLHVLAPLAQLRSLRLTGCGALTSLDDAELPRKHHLAILQLTGCDALLALPDLSALAGCEVVGLPERLQPWANGGRKAWTYDPAKHEAAIWELKGITRPDTVI